MDAFFHELHTYLRRSLYHVNPQGKWRSPAKTYERMPAIALPSPSPSRSLDEVLLSRSSAQSGTAEGILSLRECGTLFGMSMGRSSGSSRTYPSAGALYPIETYIIGRIEGYSDEDSVFHYDPHRHMLEHLWVLAPFSRDDLLKGETPSHSHLVVFTSVWGRSAAKYGSVAYNHVLIEMGHMSQNALLVATSLNLKSRPLSGFADEKIARVLDIDPRHETPIHVITLSP